MLLRNLFLFPFLLLCFSHYRTIHNTQNDRGKYIEEKERNLCIILEHRRPWRFCKNNQLIQEIPDLPYLKFGHEYGRNTSTRFLQSKLQNTDQGQTWWNSKLENHDRKLLE